MALFAAFIAAGLIGGWVCHGRLRTLAGLQLKWPALAGAGLVVQVLIPLAPTPLRWPALALSQVAVAAFLLVNVAGRDGGLLLGFGCVLAGCVLNAVVVVPNQGMPVSAEALTAIGMDAEQVGVGWDQYKHVLAGSGTKLRWLGDVVPITPLHLVASIGDFVIGAGLALVVATAMVGARPTRHPVCAS